MNLYKPGTAKYYRDALQTISIIAYDYDGFNIRSAKQMKELVDDLKEVVEMALKHEDMYLTEKEE